MNITSRQNPTIKYVSKLKYKKYRDKSKEFIIDGFYPLSFALSNNYMVEQLFICPKLFSSKFNNAKLINDLKQKGTIVTEVSKSVFAKIGCSDNPAGLLGIAKQLHRTLDTMKIKKNGLYVAVESIEQPHNLGAIIRLADTTGIDGVLVCNMRTDLYDPQTIRSSFGTIFCVNVIECTTHEAIDWCKEHNIQSLATSPSGSTKYTDVDMTLPTLLVMGAEHGGLQNAWLNNASVKITIPMFGQANSLSVSSSTAIVLYEAVRQRGNMHSRT